ncbi:MAG: histidine kinase [Saprospiraceae bacterium]|nr:histidine kinase [Saprospiraceae bacterium]
MENYQSRKRTTRKRESRVTIGRFKNQVNPHFLFNSLNTLVHIIPETPETAVRFVQKLSKVYRYILEIRETKTTPLSSELEFLNAYIFLLKERFGENIQVNIQNWTEKIRPANGLKNAILCRFRFKFCWKMPLNTMLYQRKNL